MRRLRDLELYEPRPEDDRENESEREAREDADADYGDMIRSEERDSQ